VNKIKEDKATSKAQAET
jgi:hypothetical protein